MPESGHLDSLLRNAGFTANPFSLREADRESEDKLAAYFFKHPLFDEFLGDVNRLESIVLLAARGAGKTTFRQAMEILCHDQRSEAVRGVLAVSYTEFSRPLRLAAQQGGKVDIFLHVEEILRCAVRQLLTELNEISVASFERLDKGELALLGAYVSEFSPLFKSDDHGRMVNHLLHQLAEGADDNEFDASDLFSTAHQAIIADLPTLTQPTARFLVKLRQHRSDHVERDSYILMMRDFLDLLVQLGYRAMYVLIDRLDETSLLADPQASADFVRPLLTDHQLLDEPHLAFRIFLPQHLDGYVKFRHKRLAVKHIVWGTDDLLDLLRLRLRGFSPVSSLQALCEPTLAERVIENFSARHRDIYYVDLAVVRSANNLPRNLILRCRQLLEVHRARNTIGPLTEADLLQALALSLGNDEPPPPTPVPTATPQQLPTPTAPATTPEVRDVGIYIDSRKRVLRDGKPLGEELRPIEFKLLEYLCQHRYQLCANEDIITAIWGKDYESPHILPVTLKRLRDAVEYDGSNPRFIITVRGRGIRLVDGD